MYRIVICEDEKACCDSQAEACENIAEELGVECIITRFYSGDDLLKSFEKENMRFDIGFLDIEMEGQTGIEVAEKIRDTDQSMTIVFLTAYRDYAVLGYSVQAFQYLMKPADSNSLKKVIQQDYEKRFKQQYIILDSKEGKVRINVQEIVSIETTGRKVTVFLLQDVVYYSGKLTDLLELLPTKQFVRCHLSFAVNMAQMTELTKQDIIAVNHQKIPVSRAYRKKVKEAFMQQIRNYSFV